MNNISLSHRGPKNTGRRVKNVIGGVLFLILIVVCNMALLANSDNSSTEDSSEPIMQILGNLNRRAWEGTGILDVQFNEKYYTTDHGIDNLVYDDNCRFAINPITGSFRFQRQPHGKSAWVQNGWMREDWWDGKEGGVWSHPVETDQLGSIVPRKPGAVVISPGFNHAVSGYKRDFGLNICGLSVNDFFQSAAKGKISQQTYLGRPVFKVSTPSFTVICDKASGSVLGYTWYFDETHERIFETLESSAVASLPSGMLVPSHFICDMPSSGSKPERRIEITLTKPDQSTSGSKLNLIPEFPLGTLVQDQMRGARYYVGDRVMSGDEDLGIEERLDYLLKRADDQYPKDSGTSAQK
jgi:hypothetical protein